MPTRSLAIRWPLLAIAILPVVVFYIGLKLIEALGNYTLQIPASPPQLFDVSEAAHRYFFFSSFLLYTFVSFVIAGVFCIDIYKNFHTKSQKRIAIASGSIAAVILLSIILGPSWFGSPKDYTFLGTIFETTLSKATLSAHPALQMLDVFNWMLKSANIFTAAAVPAAIFGCITSLADAMPGTPITRIFTMSYQIKRMRYYLYLTSLLLVCGLILIISWMHWPEANLSGDSKSIYESLVNSLSSYIGVHYSLIILAFYVPVSVIISHRATDEGQQALRSDDNPLTARAIDIWKEQMGLQVFAQDSYKTMAAVLSPLLTGLLGDVIGSMAR
jgi:hypothetical protein